MSVWEKVSTINLKLFFAKIPIYQDLQLNLENIDKMTMIHNRVPVLYEIVYQIPMTQN